MPLIFFLAHVLLESLFLDLYALVHYTHFKHPTKVKRHISGSLKGAPCQLTWWGITVVGYLGMHNLVLLMLHQVCTLAYTIFWESSVDH